MVVVDGTEEANGMVVVDGTEEINGPHQQVIVSWVLVALMVQTCQGWFHSSRGWSSSS